MNYQKKELPSYNLHMVKTNRFKTVSIEIIIGRKIKKEDITKSNFLSSILGYTTKKYDTKIKFTRKMESLYAASVGSGCFRMGNTINFDFSVRILDDKYSEKGLFEDTIDFVNEIIFNPNVTNGSFDKNSFNAIKHKEKSRIERFKESPGSYSVLKAFELYDNEAPTSYNMRGYIDDLNKITPDNLYEFYKEIIESKDINIFVVGDIDFEYVEKVITEKIRFNVQKEDIKDVIVGCKKHRKTILEEFESDDTNQSKLSIICSMENLTEFEKNYVINIYEIILGGNADSKFFKNIREKHSLCYYISAEASMADNNMLITSGINKDNYKKTINLIKKEMKDMISGNFTDEDIKKAKTHGITSIEELEDRPSGIIMTCNYMNRLKIDEPEIIKKKIMEVTKEDIQKVASKIYIDTVFLLGGDKK